jgi:hypothetical protein
LEEESLRQDIGRLKERITTLFNGQDRLEKQQQEFIKENKETVKEIYTEIKTIKEQLINRLPNWATALITLLFSSLVGVLVKIAGG